MKYIVRDYHMSRDFESHKTIFEYNNAEEANRIFNTLSDLHIRQINKGIILDYQVELSTER